MRRDTFGYPLYRNHRSRNLVRKIAGGALALIGGAIALFTIPLWLWKLIIGVGLAWVGVLICCTRSS